MPVRPTYPGVYIEEVPSDVRTIIGVSTSTTAFLGRFPRGPEAPVRAFNFGDFERVFGGLHADSPCSYAIKQYFLNGGSEAQIVRVIHDADPASVEVQDEDGDLVFTATAGRQLLGRPEHDPGEWGNRLRLEIDYDTTDPEEFFNLTVSEETDTGTDLKVHRSESFRNLSTDPAHSQYFESEVNSKSKLVQLEANRDNDARPRASGTLGHALGAFPAAGVADGAGFELTITTRGDAVAMTCSLEIDGAAPRSWGELRPFVQAAIRKHGAGDLALERAVVLLEATSPDAADWRFRVQAGRSLPDYSHDTTIAFAETAGDNLATLLGLADASVAPQKLALAGGADDSAPPSAEELVGVRARKTGMYALEDVDIFNLLCVPEAADLRVGMQSVYSACEDYCSDRRAFLLIDTNGNVRELDQMENWALENAVLRHKNAAVFYPRLRIPDPLNNQRLMSRAPSGTIAGLFARTDATRGVWKAPAGTDASLRNVSELDYMLTDPECGALNGTGVNCLRWFKTAGPVCWGARTLRGADALADEWKYTNVRRLALFIEESLYRGTQWAVFEPNDEPLWAQLRLNVGSFMHQLYRQGAFQGSSPDRAYQVQCDDETTTQADIDEGRVNIVVGFAPLKPAEFVIIRIKQLAKASET
ncbi:MAG: phage tail sheath C-terminal domain-containing protein [Planctomycetota bacterium]